MLMIVYVPPAYQETLVSGNWGQLNCCPQAGSLDLSTPTVRSLIAPIDEIDTGIQVFLAELHCSPPRDAPDVRAQRHEVGRTSPPPPRFRARCHHAAVFTTEAGNSKLPSAAGSIAIKHFAALPGQVTGRSRHGRGADRAAADTIPLG
jgi:hypothetical protein